MKKIKYFLFIIIAVFSFNLMVDAKVCTYKIDVPYDYGRPSLENETMLASDLYVLFGNYILNKKGVFSGNGIDYANYVTEKINMLTSLYKTTKLVLQINLDTRESAISSVYETGGAGTYNVSTDTISNKLDVNECPSALLIDNHNGNNETWDIVDLTYSDNYINLESDIANSSFNYNSLIAISTDVNNDKSYYDYYRGRACSLQTKYSSNLNYGSTEGFDILAIMKKYQIENLNAKEIEEMINSKGFDIDNPLSINQFADRYGDIIKNFIIKDYLTSDIKKDKEAFDTFKVETAACINNYYDLLTNEEAQEKDYFIEWYETYDKNNNERYAESLGGFLQLVINASENISIDDKQTLETDDEINTCGKDIFEECSSNDADCSCQCAQIILNSDDSKYNSAKEYINNQCKGIQDTTAEERCKKGAAEGWCKKNPTSITCEEVNNVENQFLTCQCSAIFLNSNDPKYNDAKEYINNRCKGIQDTTAEEKCKKGAAESYLLSHPSYCTKSDISNVQDNADKIINDIIEKGLPIIYEYAGIDINNTTKEGLCSILYDKEEGLGGYIEGGLNLIRIVGPILVIVLTGLDAMKSIASYKEDGIRKFWNNIKIRLICLVILFLVPTIVNFLLELIIKDGLCKIK